MIYGYAIIFALSIVRDIQNVFIKILLLSLFLVPFTYLIYRFCSGLLVIEDNDSSLKFSWISHPLFDFRKLKPIDKKSIKKIVVDSNGVIRKIITTESIIKINSFTTRNNEAEFLALLKRISKENNIEIIDSWDEWNEKGYLKIAYRINQGIFVLGAVVILLTIIIQHFKSIYLFILICYAAQLVPHHYMMKSKLKSPRRKQRGITKNKEQPKRRGIKPNSS